MLASASASAVAHGRTACGASGSGPARVGVARRGYGRGASGRVPVRGMATLVPERDGVEGMTWDVETLRGVSVESAKTGEKVTLGSVMGPKLGRTVVGLIRHFGCPLCWEQATALRELKNDFEACDTTLVVIGVGNVEKAREFAEALPFPLENLFVDPEREVYRLIGLHDDFLRIFSVKGPLAIAKRGPEKFLKANANRKSISPVNPSDVKQQGGLIILDNNEVIYFHVDEATGDHAPMEEVIDRACVCL